MGLSPQILILRIPLTDWRSSNHNQGRVFDRTGCRNKHEMRFPLNPCWFGGFFLLGWGPARRMPPPTNPAVLRGLPPSPHVAGHSIAWGELQTTRCKVNPSQQFPKKSGRSTASAKRCNINSKPSKSLLPSWSLIGAEWQPFMKPSLPTLTVYVTLKHGLLRLSFWPPRWHLSSRPRLSGRLSTVNPPKRPMLKGLLLAVTAPLLLPIIKRLDLIRILISHAWSTGATFQESARFARALDAWSKRWSVLLRG